VRRVLAGKFRAVVEDDADPLGQGRLLVSCPSVMARPAWAEACVPYGALVALPPVATEIWIEFEEGDADRPIWTGCRWDAAAGVVRTSASTVEVRASTVKLEASMVTVDAGMTKCSGVLQCSTLVADSVVASSYTPGAGNVW
jgi:hypothetical protein